MKVGTTGVLRAIQSLWDYFVFFEVKLAKHRGRFVAALMIWLVATIGIAIFGPREWVGPKILMTLILIAPIAVFVRNMSRADAPSKPHFVRDENLLVEIINALPSEREVGLGFELVASENGFDGPIVVSDDFNRAKMSDPDVDWELKIEDKSTQYSELVDSLRVIRTELVAYGRQSVLKALASGKALINEKKIAFAEPFPPEDNCVSVYKTDYFTGLCSSERSMDDIVVREHGVERITNTARSRMAFQKEKGQLRLPNIGFNAPPISLHFGIEVLGVSSDKVFRVPIQSHKTAYSQGLRAPLASGSIDWEDTEKAKTLKDVIRQAALRELSEEWGVNDEVRKKLLNSRVLPIGYFRSPIRNGKPQFVAIAGMPCSDNELSADTSEVYKLLDNDPGDAAKALSHFSVGSTAELAMALDNILSRHGNRIDSVALLGAAHCLQSVLETRSSLIAEVLGLKEGT